MTDLDILIENILEQGFLSRLVNKFRKKPAPEKKPYKIDKEWGKGRTHVAVKPSPPAVPKKSPEERTASGAKARTQYMVEPPKKQPMPKYPWPIKSTTKGAGMEPLKTNWKPEDIKKGDWAGKAAKAAGGKPGRDYMTITASPRKTKEGKQLPAVTKTVRRMPSSQKLIPGAKRD
jgi:hypothetical protein